MKKKLLRMICTWLCVYPIVTLLILALRMLDLKLPLWEQTLVLTMTLVPIMMLIIAPKVNGVIEPVN